MKIQFLVFLGLVNFWACQNPHQEHIILPEEDFIADLSALGHAKLSDYGFFKGELKNLLPIEGVLPYSLNAALFSDYSYKKRFIVLPVGTKANYHAEDVFDFPEGTVLIKNFYYPADFREPEENIRILETRLLVRGSGNWKALTYIWNAEQSDAFLDVAGQTLDVSWTHHNGELKSIKYTVPNLNQCKGCHLKGGEVMPIGPSARQLNRDHHFPEGNRNQLIKWQELEWIKGMPPLTHIPQLSNLEDEQVTLGDRARAWLEINCAHCHREDGPAKNSGLHLLANEKDPVKLGVGKAPVAAGKGSGGLLYDIVPGKPEASILQFRIESLDPSIMMPELGRSVVDEEGVELVRRWIMEMD